MLLKALCHLGSYCRQTRSTGKLSYSPKMDIYIGLLHDPRSKNVARCGSYGNCAGLKEGTVGLQ